MMNPTSAMPSSDARIWFFDCTSHGNGRSSTVTASCGRCSGESDTFVLNAEPSWVVLALVACELGLHRGRA